MCGDLETFTIVGYGIRLSWKDINHLQSKTSKKYENAYYNEFLPLIKKYTNVEFHNLFGCFIEGVFLGIKKKYYSLDEGYSPINPESSYLKLTNEEEQTLYNLVKEMKIERDVKIQFAIYIFKEQDYIIGSCKPLYYTDHMVSDVEDEEEEEEEDEEEDEEEIIKQITYVNDSDSD